MSILLEEAKVEELHPVHVPGVENKAADWLSRPAKRKSCPRPPELGEVQVSEVRPRGEGFYPLPTPGRQPELWGASSGEADTGPWMSLFK